MAPTKVDMVGMDLYVNNVYTGIAAASEDSVGTSIGGANPTLTMTSSSATLTTLPTTVTTQSLSTAGGSNIALTFTYTGLLANTPCTINFSGGTNTSWSITPVIATTANTITVTLFNTGAAALNGTIIFNLA